MPDCSKLLLFLFALLLRLLSMLRKLVCGASVALCWPRLHLFYVLSVPVRHLLLLMQMAVRIAHSVLLHYQRKVVVERLISAIQWIYALNDDRAERWWHRLHLDWSILGWVVVNQVGSFLALMGLQLEVCIVVALAIYSKLVMVLATLWLT